MVRMKVRGGLSNEEDQRFSDLSLTLARIKTAGQFKEFLEDLCTPLEIRSMSDRWLVARLINQGVPYREIYERTGVSTATITRVGRCVNYGSGGYVSMLPEKMKEK